MKKLLAIAVILTAFAASQSFAQGLQGSANVNLTVNAGGSVASTSPLSFGTQVQGASNVTVNPVTGGSSAAAFNLSSGTATHSYSITWTHLDLTLGGNTITWTPSVAVNTANTQSSATAISSGGSVTSDGSGNAYMWVGGTISSIPGNATPGSYSGSVTLSLAY